MSLAELIKLCPPPRAPVNNYDSQKERDLETKYGIRFPNNFIDFYKVYGAGRLVSPNSHEIFIYDPFSGYYNDCVEHNRLVVQTSFAAEKQMQQQLTAQSLSISSLFPVGCDTDESYLDWVTIGDPENWKLLLLNYESGFYEIFELTLTDFLAGYFSGRLPVAGWEHRLEEGHVQTYSFVPSG